MVYCRKYRETTGLYYQGFAPLIQHMQVTISRINFCLLPISSTDMCKERINCIRIVFLTELLANHLKLCQTEIRHALNFYTSFTLCSILIHHRNVLKAVCVKLSKSGNVFPTCLKQI